MASEAKLDSIWVPKDILPAPATILQIEEQTETTKRGPYTYYRLLLDFGNNKIYQMDAKYGNKNWLINMISNKPDQWVGKTITIGTDESGYRQIK